MRLSRRSFSLVAIILLSAAVPALGAKTAFRYDIAQRVIKACVLYVEQPGGGWANAHPGVIEGLRRTDLCPDDWAFENPLADAASVSGSATYVVKGSPLYWRVDLTDDTAGQLVGLDLIYVCAPVVDIPSLIQQKGLIQAVDNGALLWIDNNVDRASDTPTTVGALPWPFTFALTSETLAQQAPNIRIALDATHGILNKPYALGSGVRTLGDWPGWGREGQIDEATFDYITGFDPAMFRTVVQFAKMSGATYTAREPNVIAASYGSGSIVVTAGEVGADLSEWINDRLPGPNAQQKADVQFALNMIEWADRWEQVRGRPSASASSVARAPMPLELDWQYPGPGIDPTVNNIGPVVGTPVHSRGMVFAVAPTSADLSVPQLLCFDGDPKRDLDFDRESDDGLLRCDTCAQVADPRSYSPGDACPDCGGALVRDFVDYAWGRPHDLIWAADLLGTPRASSPTVATINMRNEADTFDVPVQVVLVSTVDPVSTGGGVPCQGQITCYNATIDPNVLNELAPVLRETGGILWSYNTTGFASGTADVVALSSPTVHNGWVYVLATEYDPALPDLDGKTTERVYGRAHCIDLATGGGYATWQYPTPVADIDDDGGFAGGPEPQRALPPFHDPSWAALDPATRPDLPPEPGALPVVTQAVDTVEGRAVDALLTFGTMTSHDTAAGVIHTYGAAGSSEIALVPTPQEVATGLVALNNAYHVITVNRANTAAAPNTNMTANGTLVPGVWLGTRLIVYNPATVREVIAELSAAPGEDPIALQQRAAVLVDYTATSGAVADEPHSLPGPMRWRHEFESDERQTASASVAGDQMIVSAGSPVYYQGNAGHGRTVAALDVNHGQELWSYDPLAGNPVAVTGAPYLDGVTAPAFDGDTAVVGATLVDVTDAAATSMLTSSVIGLKSGVDCTVYLRSGLGGTVIGTDQGDLQVSLYALGGDVIDPECYRVDRYGRTITFPASTATKVTAGNGTIDLGAIYGRAIEVEWTDVNGIPWAGPGGLAPAELHVVPDIERFRHVPGYVRLRHYPVDMDVAPPDIRLLDGTPVVGWTVVNHWDPADLTSPSLDGWIAMPAAYAGETVEVSYSGFMQVDGLFHTIPNAPLNLPAERHQVPGEFGPSVSAPVMAGPAIHMGTQGFTANPDNTYDNPIGPGGIAETMLSLTWDRATGSVSSALSQAAYPNVGYGLVIPAVTASPSVVGERVFVGTQLMSAPETQAGDGFVSGMKPRRLLVCDSTRLVMTTGTEPAWTCTGTAGPQRLQSFVGEDLRRPFSRPAKATKLGSGNLLVVDTGNNRVVEIDEAGRLVWPKDQMGFEYYTSSANNNLQLSRPADANRYMSQETDAVSGVTYNVWHTIIADTGNARVIDVQTMLVDPTNGFQRDGRQRHVVVALTPSALRLTGGEQALRVRYTSCQPIFDPMNGDLDGYLCAGANLDQVVVVEAGSRVVNPAANAIPPSGVGTWARWAWLYDEDPSAAPHTSADPLLFRNIKHVNFVRYEDTGYVTVTCSLYAGRASRTGAHPLAAMGAGVFEFRINLGGASGTWGLIPALDSGGSASSEEPYWHFVAGTPGTVEPDGYNYAGGVMRSMTTIVTDAGNYRKRWFPVCGKRLMSGRHLVVNSLSNIENVTHENLGGASLSGVLGSHVFEVETATGGDDNPYNDAYAIPGDRSIPEPGQTWSDPITQPTYAEML